MTFTPGKPITLKVTKDGTATLLQEGEPPKAHGGIFCQRVEVDCREVLAKVTTVLPGPVTLDLSEVEDRIRKTLNAPEGQLLYSSVVVEAGKDGKCDLVINGWKVDL